MINVYVSPKGFNHGPAMFRTRLCESLNNIDDINIVHDMKNGFDVELCFIRMRKNHNKPMVLRVDGCYYKKTEKKRNVAIEDAIKRAKHVIYQSEFSAKMCNDLLRISKKPHTVIYNGIDLDWINRINPNPNIIPGSFVTCAKWRENKRPNSTIRGFLKNNLSRHLYIIGENPSNSMKINAINSRFVHIMGSLDVKKVISIFKSCSYLIHLCHVDSCPNTVVEGLACGLNVLCTNLGGTSELVKDNGIKLNIDPWDGKPHNFKKMDMLNANVVSKGLQRLLKKRDRADRPDLDIKKTTAEYAKIIRNVVC